MTRTTVGQNIKIFVLVELLVGLSYFYSKTLFINIEVAFLSAFFVIVGSAFAYKKMVNAKLASGEYAGEHEKRDLFDTIEDPHELYDENGINTAPLEELDFKSIVKEEKAKIKTFSLGSAKYGARGSVSLFRLLPYVFLVLGFISLKNNGLLELKFYLPSLLLGIVIGYIISRRLSWEC